MIGIEYMFNTIYPGGNITIPPGSTHWVFTYSGAYNKTGTTTLSGLLGSEVDGFWSSSANPPSCAYPLPTKRSDITVLADSQFSASWPGSCSGVVTGDSYMSIYTLGSGSDIAYVFATGSNNWPWGLDSFGYSLYQGSVTNPSAQQIMENVLRQFAGKSLVPLP
jgi:hypothetical protein